MEIGSIGDEIVAVARERLVRGDTDVHVQVARPTPTRADCAAARQAQCRAGIDSGRHIDLVGLLGDHSALAMARRARRDDDLAEAPTFRAGARA